MADFNQAIGPLLNREGNDKLTDIPGDFGGLTKYGISQKAYPALDIRNLTKEIASIIYKRDYWDSIGGDDINSQPIAEAIFDAAVNHGVGRAVILAQQALMNVTVDGIMGPKTLAAINERIISQASLFLAMLLFKRLRFYSDIVTKDKTQIKFLHGWLNRALELVHV